jgi:hypothetical protein
LARPSIYFAEAYLSRERAAELESVAARLRAKAPVRHLFSYFVAEDETVFHCLEADSPDDVRRALEKSGFLADRIVAAVSVCPSSGRGNEVSRAGS